MQSAVAGRHKFYTMLCVVSPSVLHPFHDSNQLHILECYDKHPLEIKDLTITHLIQRIGIKNDRNISNRGLKKQIQIDILLASASLTSWLLGLGQTFGHVHNGACMAGEGEKEG